MLGDHRRVRLELADPPAVGVLELEQAPRRRPRSPVERGQLGRRRSCRHLRALSGQRAAAATPLRTAPSIVAGQPSRSTRPRGRRSGRPVSAGPGAYDARAQRERRLRLAADARPEQLRRAEPLRQLRRRCARRARGRASPSAPARRSRHRQILTAAPAGSCPVSAPRSKTQCASLPSRAASGCGSSAPVEEQVDADDRRVLELRVRLAEQPRRSRRRRRDDDRLGVELVERSSTRAPCAPSRRPPRARGRAASPCIQPSGRVGRIEVARLAGGEQRRADGEDAPLRAHLVGAEVQRRADEDVPEAVDRASRAPSSRSSAPNVCVGQATRREAAHAHVPRGAGRGAEGGGSGETSRRAPDRRRCGRPRRSPAARARAGGTEPPSPMRSRKRRYSVKQPSAMCWPLSGGGDGIALALGQRLHRAAERRPRFVERDLVALRRRARARPRGRPARRRRRRPSRPEHSCSHDAQLRQRREVRRPVEDVVAALLDPVERRRVEAREGGDAAALRRSSRGAASAPRPGTHAPASPGTPSARATPRAPAGARCPPRSRRTRPARPAAGRRARASSPRATSRMMLIS